MVPGIPNKPMIKLSSFLALALAVGATAQTQNQATPQQQAEAYYQQGLAAEKAGDPEVARQAYTSALRLNPRHANSRVRLNQLKSTAGAIAAKGRAAQIGAVMIPEIKLDKATLSETLEFLTKVIDRETEGATAPNFLIQDPAGKLKEAEISLQLKNVPTSAVLQYITTAANAKIRYDEHAVVIEPR
jgi:tetratricopeptide (TPR) repeat protein